MKKYIQLSLEQRKQIAILAHTTRLSKIALKIGVHKSTVSRELKRNAHFYEVDHRKQKAIAREYADPLLLESIKALPDIEATVLVQSKTNPKTEDAALLDYQ
jgi:IS30 family transposase